MKIPAALLLLLLSLSSATPILDPRPQHTPFPYHHHHKPTIVKHPAVFPKVSVEVVTMPPVTNPTEGTCCPPLPPTSPPTAPSPSTSPSTSPTPVPSPATCPPRPVTSPPPPVTSPPLPSTWPPLTSLETCPIDSIKMGMCVDLFWGLIHVKWGDPAANLCCPMLAGLIQMELAMCLCTTLRIKALNFNLYIPLALQFLNTCGMPSPLSYTCIF